jgi:hypothetical protein
VIGLENGPIETPVNLPSNPFGRACLPYVIVGAGSDVFEEGTT